MARVVRLLALVAGLTWSPSVAAAPPTLRTSVAPTIGTGVLVHERIALEGQVQARVVAGPDSEADRAGVSARVGPRFFLTRALSFGLDYGYARGVFPYDGPGREEHLVSPGLRIGSSSEGRRFAVANRVRLDLRTYREPDEDWDFHLRPRDEVTVTAIFRPWMRLSALGEALVQPDLGRVDMLQVRAGLALHGRIDLGRDERGARNRPPPALHWLLAAQVGLSPVALARDEVADATEQLQGAAGERVFEVLPEPRPDGEVIDLVFTFGLSGRF